MAAPLRGIADVLLIEPLDLVKAQPHQILLSTGSVALMASFAANDGIVAPWIGLAIAIGVEWAYLRGLAYDAKASTWWGGALNWSAFAVVVLWGTLWCWKFTGGNPAAVLSPFGLAVAHVVPIAWLSLCAAMAHRAAQRAEVEEAKKAETEEQLLAREAAEQRRLWELEQEAEDRKLARWAEAQRLKAELKVSASAPAVASAKPSASESVSVSVDVPVDAVRGIGKSRSELRGEVVAYFADDARGQSARSFADSLGISKTLLYELKKEAEQAGELPA